MVFEMIKERAAADPAFSYANLAFDEAFHDELKAQTGAYDPSEQACGSIAVGAERYALSEEFWAALVLKAQAKGIGDFD